jgi:hypothetical protein
LNDAQYNRLQNRHGFYFRFKIGCTYSPIAYLFQLGV